MTMKLQIANLNKCNNKVSLVGEVQTYKDERDQQKGHLIRKSSRQASKPT